MNTCTAAAVYIFLCLEGVVISLFSALLWKTEIDSKHGIIICHAWQVLCNNSISYRKFYNVEMLEFLKRERKKSRSLMIVIHHDRASLLYWLLPGKNPSCSH